MGPSVAMVVGVCPVTIGLLVQTHLAYLLWSEFSVTPVHGNLAAVILWLQGSLPPCLHEWVKHLRSSDKVQYEYRP